MTKLLAWLLLMWALVWFMTWAPLWPGLRIGAALTLMAVLAYGVMRLLDAIWAR